MPTADPELARLLDAYGQAEYEFGAANHLGRPGAFRRQQEARAALLAHIAANYRRVPPPIDGEPAETEEAPDPPIVAGPLSRRKVRIRLEPEGAP